MEKKYIANKGQTDGCLPRESGTSAERGCALSRRVLVLISSAFLIRLPQPRAAARLNPALASSADFAAAPFNGF